MEPRMKNVLGIAGAVLTSALWATAANAGCAKINGVYMCASWITGSEDLNATITGLGDVKKQCAIDNCPLLTGFVFGAVLKSTFDPTDQSTWGPSDQCKPVPVVDPDTLLPVPPYWKQDADCVSTGLLFCFNKGGNADNAQGQPFNSTTQLSTTTTVQPGYCDKNGKCQGFARVDLDDFSAVCQNQNWTGSFIADRFYGIPRLDFTDNKNVDQTLEFREYCELPNGIQVPGTSYGDAKGKKYECTPVSP